MSTSATPLVGGRYEMVRTLGQGSFGHTFLARDREADRASPSRFSTRAEATTPRRQCHRRVGVMAIIATSTLPAVRRDLRAEADADDAINLQRFFKTGPGEYGEGDRFLGVRVPALRRLTRTHRSLPVQDALTLLASKWHEERLLALLLLAGHYRGADAAGQQRIYDAYLANTRYINNWDLVDASAPYIVGPHVQPNDHAPLDRLAASPDVWERRIAVLATFHWIRQREFRPALRIADRLVSDRHDLIHKAVGWMLREVGNRDGKAERDFLRAHCRTMPRTMLRYAIEKFPEAERRRYLTGELPAPRA